MNDIPRNAGAVVMAVVVLIVVLTCMTLIAFISFTSGVEAQERLGRLCVASREVTDVAFKAVWETVCE